MLRRLALAGALALTVIMPAWATVTLYDDPGGVIWDFIDKYQDLAASGDDVRIEGTCASACTTIIGIVPRDRICVGPHAVLSFHSAAFRGSYSAAGTRVLRSFYADDVRRILRRHGWDARSAHPDLIPISGGELRKIIRPCN